MPNEVVDKNEAYRTSSPHFGQMPNPAAVVVDGPLGRQVGGSHYTANKIQPIEYIHANELGFIEGCVVKYVTRHKHKGGREDIEKAIHFLEMLLILEYPQKESGSW